VTAAARVRRARAALAASLGARALLRGLIAAGSVLAATAMLDVALSLPLWIRRWLVPVAVLGAALALTLSMWRARRVRSLPHVALWLEEQVPSLEYSLVTLLESPDAGAVEALETWVAAATWSAELRRTVLRALSMPMLVLGLVVALLVLLPRGAVSRVGAPAPGDALRASGGPAEGDASRSHLSPLVATVDPPAYSGAERLVIDDPMEIAALAGSGITLRGRGGVPVLATMGERTFHATTNSSEWRVTVTMPQQPAAVRLSDGPFARIVALAPRADEPPAVTLEAPPRDTVLRKASGVIPLAADARDDIGVSSGGFEYIVSSGSGESFAFRTGVLAPWHGNAARIRLAGELQLAALGLKPGDVLHLRAVAADGNDVTGPGKGASETRSLRVARAGEYDSVAVEGAAPADAEKSVLSQRILIVLAEALERRRARLARTDVTVEARRIGADQTRLRKQVGEIIFARLGDQPGGEHTHGEAAADEKLSPEDLLRAAEEATGAAAGEALDFAEGESPVVAINRPLLEAYNAMWDASRELDVGEPGRALPHMRLALAAIQRARKAERIYLRGQPPAVVVDLARVRLQGKDAGTPTQRRPRSALVDHARERAERFAAAVRTLATQSEAAVDSLLLLRVDALTDAPRLAAALAEAIDALRAGRDASTPLSRARRELLGTSSVVDSLGRWTRRP
jgi:hypothetical protein